jgi:threonylcarbamoyladenosine tRNA methylthiotransferase MtaB
MATCRLVTLGCKVNQYETQWVKESLQAGGFREASAHEPAELCVVNTCTVTAQGDSKSRQVIRQLGRRNPGTRILVMGCYATRDPDAVRCLPGVVEVVTDKRELPDVLERFGVADLPTGICRFDGRHRAFVKVQDGCVLNCTFCIIPHVRAGLRSRPTEHLEAEVCRLVENGYREIVLTGIHLGHYGVDLSRGRPRRKWCRLWHLLERLCNLDLSDRWRIRLSSLEATEVTDEFIHVLARHPRICPHLHLSLQSGSDRVLRRMRRRYRVQSFLRRVEKIRAAMENPAFTTDVIVGFPGETEEDFRATCRVVEEVGFSKLHIFPFSARRGTPAATMSDQVPAGVKQERARRLAEIERAVTQHYFQGLVGSDLEVLVERPLENTSGSGTPATPNTYLTGTACRYAPVRFLGRRTSVGRLVDVRAEMAADGSIAASMAPAVAPV